MYLFKENKKVKIIFIICIAIFILTILIFLVKNNYKKNNLGNNMCNKSIEEIEKYILNISSYKAKMEVKIESNKNTNKYIIMQEYIAPNKFKQVVLEPENIKNLEIIYDGNNLSISNSKLSLNVIYKNYPYIVENDLSLNSFISDYKENKGSTFEEKGKIVLETKPNNENNYRYKKRLYIDKKADKIEKLLIEDINEKTLVYILYNEIKINDLDKIMH